MRYVLIITALLFAAPSSAQTDLTLKVGQELDTNPIRLTGEGSEAAAAARLVAAVDHTSDVGDGSLSIDSRALGRLYYQAATEDSLSLSLSSDLRGPVARRSAMGLSVSGRNRLERARDCAPDSTTACAVNQDYSSLRGGAVHSLQMGDVGWSLRADARTFAFKPNGAFSWYGPGGSTSVDYRAHPNVSLSGFYDLGVRHYRSDRERITTANGLVSVEGERRVDRGQSVGTSVRWSHGSWSLGAEYLYQWNRSNSATKGYARHLVEPSLTGIPFGELLIRVSARIARSSFDPRRAQDATTNIDEESRNRISFVVEHPIAADQLFFEAGWTLYRQALHETEGAGQSFSRSLAYLALTFRARGERN
ncbi:MAG: hypothetical protein ACJAYU_001986 [Bradymonadia bacterium]|jgi:hypothetical protein